MSDPVQAFQETQILRQGLLDGLICDLPQVALQFSFPKRFDIQFVKVEDYRVKLPLSSRIRIQNWSACHQSDFLRALPERYHGLGLPIADDMDRLRHFHIEFGEGYLDVLAEDFVFMMISRASPAPPPPAP